MCVSLPSKLDEVQLLAHSLLQRHSMAVWQVMSSLGKANFCVSGHFQLGGGVVLFRVTHWMFIIVQLICVLHFTFQIQLCMSSVDCLAVAESCSLTVPSSRWSYCHGCHPHSWNLLFSGFCITFVHEWPLVMLCVQASYCLTGASSLILHRMAFQLPGKVVALQLDNCTAKMYLCNQCGTVSVFLSRLACYILNLPSEHGITLNSSIHSNPSQCGSWLSFTGKVGPRVAPYSFIAQTALQL